MNNKLGDRIKLLRVQFNMKQKELADYLGISASAIGMYETNRRTPDMNILTAIALKFNVTTDYLLGISENCMQPTDKKYHRLCTIAQQLSEKNFQKLLDYAELLLKDGT